MQDNLAETKYFFDAGYQFHRLLLIDSQSTAVTAFQVGADYTRRQVTFVAAVVMRDDVIVIAESEIALTSSWEIRASGLWADHNCEQPLAHWTYGLEAFALRVDNGGELLKRGFGDRLPLGWELDFESDAPTSGHGKLPGYYQCGHGHGELLIGSDSHEIQGHALRQHWWGPIVPSPVDWVPDPQPRSNARVALPTRNQTWWLTVAEDRVAWTNDAVAP